MSSSAPEGWFVRFRKRLSDHGAETRFGPYLIEGELGTGGMGVVYRARHVELERPVALKILRDAVQANPKVVERFHREALAVAKLRHPNIVLVHDAGRVDAIPYLAMELVEGETLAALLERNELDLEQRVRVLSKVAEAVHHAHENGIIHRDLKPGNILVDAAREPHVVDFGMAHLADSTVQLTHTGAVMGTPLYMAPEQVRGAVKEIGVPTDVYALGVILYEMLTGHVPFQGDNATMVYHQILAADPKPPRSENPQVPADLETICFKAMTKESDRRYADAASLAADLKAWLAGDPISARPPSTLYRVRRFIAHRRALAAAVIGSALTAVCFAIIVSFWQPKPELVFGDDFESYAPTDDWRRGQAYGRWSVTFRGGETGRMGIAQDGSRVHFQNPGRGADGKAQSGRVVSLPLADDMELRVRFKVNSWLEASGPGPWDAPWIYWHFQEASGGLGLRGYCFVPTVRGWSIRKKHPSQNDSEVLAERAQPKLEVGRWYELRIVQQGNLIEAYLDGALLASVRDEKSQWPVYTSGQIALHSQHAHAVFDDVQVYRLGRR